MSSLEGRTAIVTGGAVRIGRAIVEGLAREGVRVLLHYRRSQVEAEQVAATLRAEGCEIHTVAADLERSVAAAHTIFEAARQHFGTVDTLINCAAIFEKGSLSETTEETWDRHLGINLKTPFFLSQAFSRQLPSGRAGTIVNIIDWRGTHPVPGHAAYTISKAGLAAMTQLLAQELGTRIRVNGIAPGAILPPPGFNRAEFEKLAEKIPTGRVGSPDKIVESVLFLLRNDFINGEILNVTGGQQLCVSRDI